MNRFDTIVIIDWSGGNDRGPKPKADAIWAAVARDDTDVETTYFRNRAMAEDWLDDMLHTERAQSRTVLVGFDFPFAYPKGTAQKIIGQDDPLRLWDWFERQIIDAPKENNRFDIAAQINALFPGEGPFWGNGLKRDIAGLPRKGRARHGHQMRERREVEQIAKGSFSCWQLSGAGSVGSQTLMGLPVLSRLRRRHQAAIWPFEPLSNTVVFAEIWPSLLASVVRASTSDADIRDAVQVRVMAKAFAGLERDIWERILDIKAPTEGWILGLGFEAELANAAQRNSAPGTALPAGVDWIPVDAALAALRRRMKRVVSTQIMSLDKADGRFLAKPITAARANPPGDNSAVDGYGFAHASIGATPCALNLVEGRAAAGVPYGHRVPPGHAVRILTGALLPPGVDTIVLQEDITAGQGNIRLSTLPKKGANTRAIGEDVTKGSPVFSRGHCLRPTDIALSAALGVTKSEIFRPLRIGVLSTGNEIASPRAEAAPAYVTYDANRPMLLSMIARWRYVPVDLGHIGDDVDALRAALDNGAHHTDVIITSGGASGGDEDHIAKLLSQSGKLDAWRIAVKPGRPLALGRWQDVPVFGLPGNPVAAFVCALIFCYPSLRVLAGGEWVKIRGFEVPARFAKTKKAGRREYLRARLTSDNRVEIFSSEGSGRISGLAWAQGLVELPDSEMEIRPGDLVRYLPFSSFGL